jgi:beta-ureidopropionase / N-carbamoyl-L-amino-acid hydrolase
MSQVGGLLDGIADIGRDATRGGYTRSVFDGSELTLREWFVGEAQRRRLDVEVDRNGILWAWRSAAGAALQDAVVTGSHLDSVPGGGAYDGPLGVATAFAALDLLDARGVTGTRPLAVAAFPEEEGGRFGVACLGSRLLTGAIDPDRARRLTDADGVTFAEAARASGLDPAHVGPDPAALARIGAFVELHVEQGRGLVDLDRPVAVGASILAHGRWRLTVTGQGNHAGTTRMQDRRDPMVAAAGCVLVVRELALRHDDVRATVGRIQPVPGGTNVVASRVEVWVDVRHPDDAVAAAVVAALGVRAEEIAAAEGCTASLVEESLSGSTSFDPALRDELAGLLGNAPVLPSGAGHDAGVLADHVPTAMLFVRNPSGISHAPDEHVDRPDLDRGAVALATTLEHLLRRPR